MKRNIPLPNTPSIMSCQTTTPSLQSMRDLLSTEIYKYQSRELLNKLMSAMIILIIYQVGDYSYQNMKN